MEELARLAKYLDLWRESSKNPDMKSMSDRLRPPYPMPLPWLEPANAGASRIFEVGFNRLPSGYQKLLKDTQAPSKVELGALAPEWSVRGLYTRPREGKEQIWDKMGLPRRMVVAEDPQVAAHELSHVLRDLHPEVNKRVPKDIEEVWARVVGQNPQQPETGRYPVAEAERLDRELRTLGGETQPLLSRIKDYLFRKY
jgi:hypothetical protein